MSKPLVSVFIPYYNDEKFLKTSIESVLNNNYQNFELILLNHATKDSCREIAHSYNDDRIKHIDMSENLGGGSGLLFQKMLDVSTGKYVKVVCADDELRKDGLELLVEYMETHPEKDFVFGNVEYIDKLGKDLNDDFFNNRPHFSIENDEVKCLRLFADGHSFLPWMGALIKKKILDEVKIEINKTYIYRFDCVLWITLLCHGYKMGYLCSLVANYRIHDAQVSSLANDEKCGIYIYYEDKTYYKYFLTLNDVNMAKKVWPESKLANKLVDIRDIPFFVAYNLFINNKFWGATSSYIDKILNDDLMREHIENTFGYGIREYREDILKLSKKNKKRINGFTKFKQKIYTKPVKKLGLRDMSFLVIHRLYNIVTFSELRTKIKERKNKKRYSL